MRIASTNPATGEVIRTFQPHSAEEIDGILDAAVAAQAQWRRATLEERAAPMRMAARLLRERAKQFAALMAVEMGKVLKDGEAEAQKCALVCDYYAENAGPALSAREQRTDASSSYVRHDPLGVVLAVMPWNFPFWQVFRFIAPNFMAGNGGLLKHASNVPQCALAIESLMNEAGFPKGLFRTLLVGSHAVGSLIADPRIAAATLTGSEAAGRDVGKAAGEAIKPVVLELGGSDPFIVLEDADLDSAAETAARARCINAGQSCIAAKRFIVVNPVHDPFLEKFVAAMRRVKVGDPQDDATDIGPQARTDLRDELHRQVEQATAQGARVVLGGKVPDGPGAYYPATILADVHAENVAYSEEIFGPVASVIRATDAEDAIRIANDTRFGLGASLWTRDLVAAQRWIAEIQAGSVFVNGMVKSDPRLPFGGVKASGVGRELGIEGLHAFTNVKTVWVK